MNDTETILCLLSSAFLIASALVSKSDSVTVSYNWVSKRMTTLPQVTIITLSALALLLVLSGATAANSAGFMRLWIQPEEFCGHAPLTMNKAFGKLQCGSYCLKEHNFSHCLAWTYHKTVQGVCE